MQLNVRASLKTFHTSMDAIFMKKYVDGCFVFGLSGYTPCLQLCDNQRADEIKALKILLFSIIRNMPHDTAISIINNIVNTDNNEVLNRLCLEITDAMLNTTRIVD